MAEAPVTLRCVGRLFAGESSGQAVEPGTCVAVATGAPMPPGADAVVMVEDTEAEGETVRIAKSARPGKNLARRGEDIRAGDVVVEAGVLLNPGRLGALAATGRSKVRVYARPRVVVIPTGAEVVPPGSGPLEEGQIYDINTTTLLAALATFGAEASGRPPVKDELEALRESVAGASEAEVLVLTGGSSVGERDLLADVFAEAGELVFHGLAVKPGKPTLLARRAASRQIMVGMPGYPTSCLSNAYLLLGPLVARIGRRPAPRLETVEAPLAGPVPASAGRLQVFTVSLRDGRAHPAYKTSGAITSMSQADGYIEVPPESTGLEAGTRVAVKLF